MRGVRFEIPESWALVSEAEGITVQVTAVGSPARVWVEERSRERIVVRADLDTDFDYQVNGVRRGYADPPTILPNEFFKPTLRGVPYGLQYPEAVRRILVENGTLNADFTPNEATAARLGWELAEPGSRAAEEIVPNVPTAR